MRIFLEKPSPFSILPEKCWMLRVSLPPGLSLYLKSIGRQAANV